MLGALKLYGCGFLIFRIVLWSILYIPRPPGFGTTPNITAKIQIPRWLLGSNLQVIIILLRLFLGEHEERQLKNLFRLPLQRIWASSFKTNGSVLHDPGRTAVKIQIHRMIYLVIAYAMLLTLAILLFLLHVPFIRYNLERERRIGPHTGLGWAGTSTFVMMSLMIGPTNMLDKGYPMKMIVMSATVTASLLFIMELILRMTYILYVVAITHRADNTSRQRLSSASPDSDVTDTEDPREYLMIRGWYIYGGLIGVSIPTISVPMIFSILGMGGTGLGTSALRTTRIVLILVAIVSGGLGVISLCYAFLADKPMMLADHLRPSEQEAAPEPTVLELQSNAQDDNNEQDDEERQETTRSNSTLKRAATTTAKMVRRIGKFSARAVFTATYHMWDRIEWFSNQMGAQRERNRRRRAREIAAEQYDALL